MPSPAEHYLEAEHMLEEAMHSDTSDPSLYVAIAQVHATLATAVDAAGSARLLEQAEEGEG